jgi:hypothetical protein
MVTVRSQNASGAKVSKRFGGESEEKTFLQKVFSSEMRREYYYIYSKKGASCRRVNLQVAKKNTS